MESWTETEEQRKGREKSDEKPDSAIPIIRAMEINNSNIKKHFFYLTIMLAVLIAVTVAALVFILYLSGWLLNWA